MKKTIIITALLLGSIALQTRAEEPATKKLEGRIEIPNGHADLTKGEVVKVYKTDKDGATFRAYVVMWQGKEVIVSDPLGRSNFNAGETINFMVLHMEMPLGDEQLKVVQFNLSEF